MKNVAVIVVLLLMGIAGIGAMVWQNRADEAYEQAAARSSVNPKPEIKGVLEEVEEKIPLRVEVSISFFGDVFWGRRMQTWSEASEQGIDYPFAGLAEFDKQPEENWVANLECPVTTKEVSQAEQEDLLRFNCKPEYLPAAREYFDIFSLANNHTDNVEGEIGLQETKELLSMNNLQYFGHFDNASRQDICEVVSTKARIVYNDNTTDNTYIPVALCGYHNVFKLPTPEEIAVISDYATHVPTFVMPHQGAEYIDVADNLQTQTFRQMIDAGADAVLGGHTHSVINTEVYNNKLIAYSLGNFIFDQQFIQQVTTGLGVKAKLNFEYPEVENIVSIKCYKHQNGCLEKIKQQNPKKPEFTIEYKAVVSTSADQQTTLASPELTKDVLQNIQWENTVNSLKK